MAGTRGKITKAKGGKKRTIYLSNVFGIWPEKNSLHISMQKGNQDFHTSIDKRDGLLYSIMLMLYHHGKSI